MKTKIPNKPIAFILHALKPARAQAIFIALLIVVMEVFSGIKSISIQKIVDGATLVEMGTASVQSVALWVFILLSLILLGIIVLRIAGLTFSYMTLYTRTRVVKSLFEYLSRHSFAYFSDRLSGSLSSRIDTLANNVSTLMGQFLWDILTLFLGLIVSFFIIYSVNPTIAFTFISGIILLIPLNVLITKKQALLSKRVVAAGAKLRGFVVDVVSNIGAVHQYARIPFELRQMDGNIDSFQKTSIASFRHSQGILFINNITVWLFTAVVIASGFYLWTAQAISIGSFILITTVVSGYIKGLSQIGKNINSMVGSYGELEDGLEELIRPHEVTDTPHAKALKVSGGAINFKNVSFDYEGDKNSLLQNFNLEIKEGQKVGVVGRSGAGKTTLMKLLLRQYDLQGGSIEIDGQNIAEVTQDSLRKAIAIVPQEPALFHRSIEENILYGNISATKEKMVTVSKKAFAHEFVDKLQEKYKSMVGERGVKLSVGQKQRIAIARAFLKDSPILILDEATSALDSKSEVAVQKALKGLMQNKTVFAVAHRLSTLREMDRVLVFENGGIIEDGTHEELIKLKGSYADLWKHQAEGFVTE